MDQNLEFVRELQVRGKVWGCMLGGRKMDVEELIALRRDLHDAHGGSPELSERVLLALKKAPKSTGFFIIDDSGVQDYTFPIEDLSPTESLEDAKKLLPEENFEAFMDENPGPNGLFMVQLHYRGHPTYNDFMYASQFARSPALAFCAALIDAVIQAGDEAVLEETDSPEWKMVCTNTFKLRVRGGWLYRYGGAEIGKLPVSMAFVPD